MKKCYPFLIARFWDVQNGAIKIGRKDIRDINLDSIVGEGGCTFMRYYNMYK